MKLGHFKLNGFKAVLLALFALGLGVSIYRMFVGLAPVTNLSDNTPWGLWKAFDVIAVVPLGAAGFTMAFVRYFVNDARYEMIARRSVIWAAIAYISMGARLFFDIGLPWRLPNPLIFWGNIHSALFEVAWCVAIYLIVLFFENLPRISERIGSAKAERFTHTVHKIVPWFALVGILLSSMHQSSLGTLYMIVGKRIDPLWYHPWLNYIYLLTAIAMGLSVTIVIEGLVSRYYKTKFETSLLAKLSVAVATALSIALIWRVGAMAAEGTLGEIFRPRTATYLWWLETLTGFVLPIAILAQKKLRNAKSSLLWASGLTIFGTILLRMNVVFTGMAADMGSTYFPSLTEILFTVGWTAGTILAFTYFAEKLPGILGQGQVEVTESKAAMAADD